MSAYPCVAIIVAAGSGKRMQTEIAKQYLKLKDKPVLVHTLEAFEFNRGVDEIVLVVKAGDEGYCREDIVEKYRLKKVNAIISGGETRQQSVYQGLEVIADSEFGLVLVHDGVRPLVSDSLISRTIAAAEKYGSATAAVPIKDTVKLASGGFAAETLDRERLWKIQTPQGFKKNLLMRAHAAAKKEGVQVTDDAALVEHLGNRVKLIEGQERNLKITCPADLVVAGCLLDGGLKEDPPCA